jgi:hypothetical protein
VYSTEGGHGGPPLQFAPSPGLFRNPDFLQKFG